MRSPMHYNFLQSAASATEEAQAPTLLTAPGPRELLMARFRSYLQHCLNPLHVYCRLCDRGFSSRAARRLSSVYERLYRVCGLGG